MKSKSLKEKHLDSPPLRMGKPLISVCLIAKNEEKFLNQCLHSIKPIANEIIFVDTGSTDRTLEIARKYTNNIWTHPWNDNFSEARNVAMRHATGDWIFTIDADEILDQKDIPVVRKAVEDGGIDAVVVQIVNTRGVGRGKGIHNQERILRNNGIIHYEGRVHNRVVGIALAKVYPIKLIHYGYGLVGDEANKKFNRTFSLLKKDLEDDPGSPATHHYLSCSFLSRNMYQEALDHGLKAIRQAEIRNNHDTMLLWTHYNVSLAHYRLNNTKLAEETALHALDMYPDHIDSHFMLIVIYFDQKRWKDLIYHADHYLRLSDMLYADPAHFGTLVSCSLNEAWNIHVLLGIAHYENSDPKFAESFAKAIEVAPEPFIAARAAGIYFADAGVAEYAKKYLDLADKLSPGDATVGKYREQCQTIPNISCVMIVKNEECFLEKCLQSIKDWVDEIIIVDTGSDDDTVNIARRFTDKVYFHPWEGSFSKARNQALDYATGDWIFIIDGDEEMIPGSGQKLRAAVISADKADAFLVTTVSTYGNGQKTSRHNSERLFRRNGIIHYESIVHNRLVGHTSTKPTKIEIMHYGYNVDEKKANEKFIRTTELLKKQIAEAPENPLPHHYLGTSFLTRGWFRECIVETEKAIDLAEKIGDNHPVYLWSHQNAAMAYYYLGDMEHAKRHALRTLENFDGYMDSYHVLTLVAAEQGDWNGVQYYGERYLQRLAFYEANSDRAGVLVNTSMAEGSATCLIIGHAWYRIGDRKQMMDYYCKAEKMANEPWQSWKVAATYHIDKTNDYEEAQQLLDQALHLAPNEQSILHSLARLASLSNNRGNELHWLTKLQDTGSKDEAVLNRLAALLLEDGKTDDAVKLLENLLGNSPDNLQALINIGIAYKTLQKYAKAVENLMKVIELTPSDPRPWHHLSEISMTLGNVDEAEIFRVRSQTLQQMK